jgi:hypothetical protein
MLRLACAAALVASLIAGRQTARADDAAKAIIAKAIEAEGGAALLKKYQASTAKFKGRFHSEFGDGDMSGTIQAQGADKLRFKMTLKVGGSDVSVLQVVNGDKAWFSLNGNEQELEKEQSAEMREQLHAGQVADLRGLDASNVKLTAIGDGKVGDRPVVGVRVSCAGFRDVDLYFDKDNSLLLKSQTRGKDFTSGLEFTEVKFYRDYKKVNGLAAAHKVEVQRDGKPHAESELTELTLAENLPDSTFAKP